MNSKIRYRGHAIFWDRLTERGADYITYTVYKIGSSKPVAQGDTPKIRGVKYTLDNILLPKLRADIDAIIEEANSSMSTERCPHV